MRWLTLFLIACTTPGTDSESESTPSSTDTEPQGSSTDSDTEPTDTQVGTATDSEDTAPPRDTADRDTPQWDCDNRFWYEGDLVISTDAAADAFCDEYNGVQGDLTLDLSLESDDPIQWLDGVACICEVTGDYEMFFYDELGARHASTDLELDNLRIVGGDLYIHEIPGITGITGLSLLEEVGGDVRLIELAGLSEVSFESLASVGGDVVLTGVEGLERLALPSLTQAGSLQLGEAGGSEWHWSFEELDLSSLSSVTGSLVLAGLGPLEAVEAPELTSVGGALVVEGGCAGALALDALQQAGSLELDGLCELEDFTGLAALASLEDASAEPVLQVRYLDHLDEASVRSWAATLDLPEGSETEVQEGSCDTMMLLTYGRSQEEACSPDTGGY